MPKSKAQSTSSKLNGVYELYETIGSGGFAKVKRGVHIATGTNVAIKVMDKKFLKENLPRVRYEIEALKSLCHQNICRLYEAIETDTTYYLVLEYCAGGELFDYIVERDGLKEPEARHFFRQIIAAVMFVHANGYAHRDLKPENLLLTEDLRIKLVDFGLCAKPEYGLADALKTCCGSKLYAAPELLSGKEYFGNEADIWSMGVLLYTLVCGCLPFEDEGVNDLYKKMIGCKYEEPDYLSASVRNLLRSMLQPDPKKRIKACDLLMHPWVVGNYTQPLKWQSIFKSNVIDEECAMEIANSEGWSLTYAVDTLQKWKYDHVTATYLILLSRKSQKLPIALPPKLNTPRKLNVSQREQILTSPTIHASLEVLDNEEKDDVPRFVPYPLGAGLRAGDQNGTMYSAEDSYHTAIDFGLDASVLRPNESLTTEESNSTAASLPKGRRAIYATPSGKLLARHALLPLQDDYVYQTPFGQKLRAAQNETSANNSPEVKKSRMSAKKTPQTARRVFCSVERKIDRVIHMLTPRRSQPHCVAANNIAKCKGSTNVTLLPNKTGEEVITMLLGVLESKGIACKRKGWTLRGKSKDTQGRVALTVEFEIVRVGSLGMIGVRRKRLNGDAWLYKRVCEVVLNWTS